MTKTGRKRPWLAVLLAFIYPGLGHIYLRKWVRSLLWFGLVFTTSSLLIGDETTELVGEFRLESLLAAGRAMPPEATAALLAITVLSMADAYWVAIQENTTQEVETGTTCPNCGKELDEDLAFCHWCTTELEPVDTDRE